MLRVSCWTGTEPARRRAPHSGSPTRMTMPLPTTVSASAGNVSGSGASPASAASSAAVSTAASAARTRSDGADSSSAEKPASSSTPVSSPVAALVGDRLQRIGRPGQRAQPAQARAERVGVARRERAQQLVARDVDAPAHRLGAERGDLPPSAA